MNTYRKISTETVEVFELTRSNLEDVNKWPSWLYGAYKKDWWQLYAVVRNLNSLYIRYEFDDHDEVHIGDYIILNPDGSIYQCSAEEFHQCYQKTK